MFVSVHIYQAATMFLLLFIVFYVLSILVCTSFGCVCMHCNESINLAINSQSYNNHSHVHMNMI